MYPKKPFQFQPVPARFAWDTTLVAGLCQFPLSSPLRESISQAWMNKSSGDSTEVRTPISSVKGWPPSQLEDGTIKQDSTFACSVVVFSTVTTGREEYPRPSLVDLALSRSPCIVFREFTTALNPLESLFPRLPFIMAEISSALQVMLYPSRSEETHANGPVRLAERSLDIYAIRD